MFIGLGRFDILVGPHNSLKSKRAVVRRLIADLHQKFALAVAETDFQNLLQRTEVSVAVVSADVSQCQRVLETCEKFIAERPEYELLAARVRVISDDDV